MKTSIWYLLALGLLSSASAMLVDFSFPYDRVDLKNGKRLEKVTFYTYDTLSERVGAVAGKTLLTLRLNDLPNEIAARIKAEAPVQTKEEIEAEKKQVADRHEAAMRRAQAEEERALAEATADRDARRKLDVKRAELAIVKEDSVESTVAAAAREMATHYFTYEADPHSSTGYVFDSSVLLEDPEAVPGWTNRWRVRGKVGVQYLTRNGESVGRSSKEFEVLIDAPPKGKPKLVDVTVSR
jgi:FKBP-type peptidyl-prolyl cis-trans isomerase